MTDSSETFGIGGRLQRFELLISNYKKTEALDITGLVGDLSFTENIFNSTMSGTVLLIDSNGLLNRTKGFRLRGEEWITLSYEVGQDRPAKTLTFFVYKIDSVNNANNLKHKRYALHFCSAEELYSASGQIQKSYREPISNIVKTILSDWLQSKKNFAFQPTKGNQTLIIPKLRPLQAIEFLRRRSIAAELYTSSSYLFFERTDGFLFADVEWLIRTGLERAKKAPQYYRYFISDQALQNSSLQVGDGSSGPENYNIAEFKTLFGFRQDHMADTIEKIKNGMFNAEADIFDPVSMTLTPFKFQLHQSTTSTLGKYQENTKEFVDEFSDKQGRQVSFVAKDSTVNDTFIDEIITHRTSYMTRLAQQMFMADAIGDPGVCAGDIIEIPNIPDYNGNGDLSGTDEYLSGFFLIAGITHRMTRTTYTAGYELYRNGSSHV